MKTKILFLGLAKVAVFFSQGCNTKEINLLFDNPVEIATEFVSNAFINEPLEASILFTPKNGEYPVDYSLRYEVEEGSGVYELFSENFSSEDTYTFANAPIIPITISYQGATEGIHRSKWILRNDFDQEFVTYIEFDLKKNPEPVPNEAPTAVKDMFTTKEEVEITLDVISNDEDKEGDSLVITTVSTPENGTAIISDNKIVYTPNEGFVGEETLTYEISDGNENIATTSVTILVIEESTENLPPSAMVDNIEIEINTKAVLDVLENDTDPEGMDLEIILVGTPANGTATFEGAIVTYIPNEDYIGIEEFSYTVKDSEGLESNATVTITIIDSSPNIAPEAKEDMATTAFETFIVIDVVKNDTDNEGEAITLISVESPTNGTAVLEGNEVKYTPNIGYSGTETFTYTIKDESENEASGMITIVVEEKVNLIPVANSDEITIEIFEPTPIDVLLNDEDPENDVLKVISFTEPSNGKVEIIDNKIVYEANSYTYQGTDSFTYVIEDIGGNISEPATVSVNVLGKFVPLQNSTIEQRLVIRGADSDGLVNGRILVEDANKVKDFNLNDQPVGILEDLQFLPNIESLSLVKTGLTEIDLSKNKKLKELFLSLNDLKSLDISGNPMLENLVIGTNLNLTSIVSNVVNPNMKFINCQPSNLQDFDGSNFPNLEKLTIQRGSLQNIDISKNSKLKEIDLSDNNLDNIEFSADGSSIIILKLDDNKIEDIDISNLVNLQTISLSRNRLRDLNANNLNGLQSIIISGNFIESIQLKGIDFNNIISLRANNMFSSSLCIAVEDPVLAQERTNNEPFAFSFDLDYDVEYNTECL